ncbi:hypothetical protein ACFSX9_06460 [Flavobacterium ardleyense]|uniref:Uncharacterized protein n=1 Tax=Flavobacterium ardleyense TaxID=2038737 RepID=A0ABW5Z8F7_9FLAO
MKKNRKLKVKKYFMNLFGNNIETHFKKISINGRMAFGVKCLETYLIENNIKNIWTERLINTLWEFTSSHNLPEWETKISDLTPECILDTHPENIAEDYKSLSESEFNSLKDFYLKVDDKLIFLINLVIDIGTTDLYGATGKYSENTLKSTMEVYKFCKKELNVLPDLNKFNFTKFSENDGWGKRINKKFFK